jgi:hypothetical protein
MAQWNNVPARNAEFRIDSLAGLSVELEPEGVSSAAWS